MTMKQIGVAVFLMSIVLLNGCDLGYHSYNYTYHAQVAVTISKDSLHRSVRFLPPQNLHLPGKIYTYGQILLVVDRLSGVHIFDNADPHNPTSLGFIAVPGCNDIAVKNSSLYIDNAIDLVTINLADVRAPIVSSRVQDIFPPLQPPQNDYYYSIVSNIDYTKQVIIGWKDTIVHSNN